MSEQTPLPETTGNPTEDMLLTYFGALVHGRDTELLFEEHDPHKRRLVAALIRKARKMKLVKRISHPIPGTIVVHPRWHPPLRPRKEAST